MVIHNYLFGDDNTLLHVGTFTCRQPLHLMPLVSHLIGFMLAILAVVSTLTLSSDLTNPFHPILAI